jgi:hypothetical protein
MELGRRAIARQDHLYTNARLNRIVVIEQDERLSNLVSFTRSTP